MSEAYTSGVVETQAGIWLKHGHTAINLLDGYQVIATANPHAVGQIRGARDGTLWLWTGTMLRRFSSGIWSSFPVPEVTDACTLRQDGAQIWRITLKHPPNGSAHLGLAPLSQDRVMILLPDRILEFDSIQFRTTTVLRSGPATLSSFLAIYPRSSGGVWIAGHEGIGSLLADGHGGWRWFGLPRPPQGFSDFSELTEANRGDLFVTAMGRQDNTVLRFLNRRWLPVFSSQSAVLRGWSDGQGTVWIQDGSQIVELAGGAVLRIPKVGPFAGVPLSMQLTRDGTFWVATSQGAAHYELPLWRSPDGLPLLDDVVNAITEDRSGRLWFAAASALISFDGQNWKTFRLPRGHQPWEVYTDSLAALPDGVVVLRSTAANLLAFDPRTRRFGTIRHPQGREIGLFVRHPKGILVQTFDPDDHSTFHFELFDGRTFRTVVEKASIPEGDELRHLLLDQAGNLWAGSVTGFEVYRRGKLTRQAAAQGYTDGGCYLIFQSPSGTLYAGGPQTLFRREGQSWLPILHDLDRTRSVIQARDGTLWVASGSGIHHYRNGTWISNGAEEGLPSTVAYRVFEDSRGRIWAATTRGIALYYPGADRDPPLTVISKEQNPHEFGPDGQARLVFTGIDKWKQTPSGRLLFSWRLDGSPWSQFSSQRFAGFKHLPVGTRRFEVRAMDRNGNIDPHPAAFRFSVIPPWYRNGGFQMVAALSLLCIIGLLALAVLSYCHRGRLIAELHRKKRLETDRQSILEMVARRKPLPLILQRIARAISVNSPGTMCGVIQVSEGKLKLAAEHPLPGRFRDHLATIPADSPFDDLWRQLNAAASTDGLAGCRFYPIRTGEDELLGAIAVYLGQKIKAPPPIDVPLIMAMSNLAGAAIDNARLYQKLARQAGQDPLTGLPNRLTFESQLTIALASAVENAGSLAVGYLDLDGFKQINDSLGHRIGDLLLKLVAARLTGAIPPGGTLARIGGDEFTLLLQTCADPDAVAQIATRMLEALGAPCAIEGHPLSVTASIGISLFPQDGIESEVLQKHADSAMYRAKTRGRNGYEFFSPPTATAGKAPGVRGSREEAARDLRLLGSLSVPTPPAPADRSVPRS